MAIGGFNGTDPAPTLAEFEKLVSAGDIHYFIGGGAIIPGGTVAGPGTGAARSTAASNPASQITAWVEAHFPSTTIGGATVYDLAANSGLGVVT
jgi:hypothetical protein